MSSYAVGEPVLSTPSEELPSVPPATALDALFDDPAPPPPAPAEPAPDSDSDDGGLFGDDDDEAEAPQPSELDDGLTDAERARRQHLEYDEEHEEMEIVKKHEAIAQVELANFGMPASAKVWHARLPNFLSLQPQAFDDVMWEPEDADEPAVAPEGGAESSPGTPKGNIPDENVIRWRWAKDAQGVPFKESNARTIRWSDGSLSLQVGAELFDISATVDHSATLATPSAAPAPAIAKGVPASLSALDATRGHGLTYLTAEHAYQGLIEAQASVYGTLTFRPTTLQSNTHRRLAGSIAGRYVKGRGIKMAALPDEDPEKKKLEREKEELARAKKLKKAQQGGSARAGGKKARKETRFDAGSDGEDDGEAAGSRGAKRGAGYDSEDMDDDGFIEHDTDSDGDEPSAKRSRKPSPGYSDDEPDEMDEAEARIEREEHKRKERKQGKVVVEAPAPRRRMVIDESDEE